MTTLPCGTPIAANRPKGALSATTGVTIAAATAATAVTTTLSPSINTQVELTDSAAYREVLEINPIRAIGGTHDLRVRSQPDTARDPEAWHLRYRVALDTAGLERLHQALGAYLQAIGSDQSSGGRS